MNGETALSLGQPLDWEVKQGTLAFAGPHL